MRVPRKIWMTSLTLVLLSAGAQGISWATCIDPAPMTVLNGPGDSLLASVQSPDQDEWVGWVTMTVEVDGQTYTFSYQTTAPAGGGTRTDRLFFSGTPTVHGYQACAEPSGMTESPEPVAIVEVEPQE